MPCYDQQSCGLASYLAKNVPSGKQENKHEVQAVYLRKKVQQVNTKIKTQVK